MAEIVVKGESLSEIRGALEEAEKIEEKEETEEVKEKTDEEEIEEEEEAEKVKKEIEKRAEGDAEAESE